MRRVVRTRQDIEDAIEAFAQEPNGALIPLPDPLVGAERELIVSLAVKHRLPNLYAYRYYPEIGGLTSYGADNLDLYRRAADYIDRILKGEKPADLPIQFPTKYHLVINLKAAKTLGLEVQMVVLVRADEVMSSATSCCSAYVAVWHDSDEPITAGNVRSLG